MNPAPLTITADSLNKIYGQTENFPGTDSPTSGLINSDTVASVTLSSTGAVATATVAGSPYAITRPAPSAPVSATTRSATSNGSLTVNAAPLTITADSMTKTYGQTVIFAGTEFTTSGLVNGDSVSSVSLSAPARRRPRRWPAPPTRSSRRAPSAPVSELHDQLRQRQPDGEPGAADHHRRQHDQNLRADRDLRRHRVHDQRPGQRRLGDQRDLNSTGAAATAPVAGSP